MLAVYAYFDAQRNLRKAESDEFNFVGTWSSGGTYASFTKDSVNYSSSQYVCIVNNVGYNPSLPDTRENPQPWSPLVLISPATPGTNSLAQDAFNLAELAYDLAVTGTGIGSNAFTLATAGSNLAWEAFVLAQSGTSGSDPQTLAIAQAAFSIAVIGTNVGTNAYNLATSAFGTASEALSIAVFGTNTATQAQATASEALAIAITGTNTGNAALTLATAGSNLAWSAYVLAEAGTNNSGSQALAVAQAAFSIAVIGTNVGTNAYNLATSAFGTASEALSIAVIGTNTATQALAVANEALSIAIIGTNTGTNAYNLATSAFGTASEALSIAVIGTNTAVQAQAIGNEALRIAIIGTNVGTNALNAATSQFSTNSLYSVTSYGAVGNGTADDTAAFNSAVTAAQSAGGGIILIPKGTYKITSTITVSTASVQFNGVGDSSVLAPAGNFDVFSFIGSQTNCGASNFHVNGTGHTGGNVFSILSSHRLRFSNITADAVFKGWFIETCNVCVLEDIWFNNVAGTWFIKWLGDNTHRSDVLSLLNVTASGTSTADGVIWDGNCDTMRVHALGLVGFNRGIHVLQSSGSNMPMFLEAHDLEIDFPHAEGILIDAGLGFTISNCYVQGSATSHGVSLASGVDQVTFTGGRITGHSKAGIHSQATGLKVVGVEILTNSQSGAGSFSGIDSADGCIGAIVGNHIAGANQKYGIDNNGTTRLVVVGNDLTGNQTAEFNDGSGTMIMENQLKQRPFFSDATAYLSSPAISISTLVMANNTLYMMPIWVPDIRNFTSIALGFVSAAVVGTAHLGIYRCNRLTGHPTTLIVDAGTVNTGTTGTKTIAINVTLNPGLFMLAIVASGAPTVHATLSDALGIQMTGGVNAIGGLSRIFSFAALPADESAQTYALSTAFLPAVGIR
jgi:hypothetical protein